MSAATYTVGQSGARAPSPAVQATLFVLAHGLFWTLAPGFAHDSPPVDTLEVYMWARNWILVSNKHPNMAGWLLAASQALTGSYGWSAYILAQTCTCVTILFLYLLGRDIAGETIAVRGAILACTLGYLSWFTPQYNANVASLPFWAGFIWALWQARRDATLLRWIVVGLFGAGLFYCKISGAILLAVAGAYAFFDDALRRQFKTSGPWVAAGIFIALILPALIEIRAQNYLVFEHAAGKARGASNLIIFLAGQLLMCSVMGLTMLVAYRRTSVTTVPCDPGCRFITVFTLAPMMVLVTQSLILSTRLHDLWTIPMGSILGLAAAMHAERLGFKADDKRIRVAAMTIIIIGPLLYGLVKVRATTSESSTTWPQREFSRHMEALWEAETKSPLMIVAGDPVEAGMVALTAKHRPSLIIHMDRRNSPWISADQIEKHGVLVMWHRDFKEGQQQHWTLTRGCKAKQASVPWPSEPQGGPFVLNYCIIPPRT